MTHARLLAAARFVALSGICFLLIWPSMAMAQSQLRGRVVDSAGAPMVRVPVSLVTADRAVVTTTLTDAAGTFVFDRVCDKCRAQAALSGFTPASADLSTTAEVTLTLAIAPVRESVVVTATRGDAPTGQLAASVSCRSRVTADPAVMSTDMGASRRPGATTTTSYRPAAAITGP